MEKYSRDTLPYRLGGLLYTPAGHAGIAHMLAEEPYPGLTAVAFCLEDSIRDDALLKAEASLHESLREVKAADRKTQELPLLFVRIRMPEHLERLHEDFADVEELLTGYILPKFDLSNADEYLRLIQRFNEGRIRPLYIMPILESRMIAERSTRMETLYAIRAKLLQVKEYVLNVRVGGNDFSNLYGLRRSVHQTIYDIGIIRDILMDILNVFSLDFVVSGPVWEYFGTDRQGEWADGLQQELLLDRLNGFVGKTAIHPAQLPVIYESLQVSCTDYEDACRLLEWSPKILGVAKSADGSRMNEVKCHGRWAKRICCLAEVYGIRDEQKGKKA